MNINRREFRRKLGTRTARRMGTKMKAISGAKDGGRGMSGCPTRKQQLRYPRRSRPRPAVLLKQLIRQAQMTQTA